MSKKTGEIIDWTPAEVSELQSEPAGSLPTGQVLPVHVLVEKKAEHERIVFALKKLKGKCSKVSASQLREIETRFWKSLYLQGHTATQWYKHALAITEEVLHQGFNEIADKVSQVLFVSSRFHFSVAPQPEILAHYEDGEDIPQTLFGARLNPDEHSMRDISGYLENRLGSTLIELLDDSANSIEIFLGSREDMLAYYRAKTPPSALMGELDSPTSTEFYLFLDTSGAPTLVIGGISSRSRFYHQLLQLGYAGIDLKRVRVRGTVEAMLTPRVEALRRELAKLPVQPTIAVVGQRWWPMEILGRLAGFDLEIGQGYRSLSPTRFKIGPFVFDYLIANVAGAPAARDKVGIVALRMPNGSLAGTAVQALVEYGTSHVLLAGAGGSLADNIPVGSYHIFTTSAYGGEVRELCQSAIFTPSLPEAFPVVPDGRNVTVDSPLQETNNWLREVRAAGYTCVDVESAHIFDVLAKIAERGIRMRVTPGLFVSDIVGGQESLTEKISQENAYTHLQTFLEAYFTQVGLSGVYDTRGVLHRFSRKTDVNPALIGQATEAPDVARQAILGIRLDSEDFCVLSTSKRKVDYPDLQSMAGHKHILYVIPPAEEDEQAFRSFLKESNPAKLFLLLPANTPYTIFDLAHRHGYETIVVIEPQRENYPRADFVISRDSGWGTYETVVAQNTRGAVVLGEPAAFGELLVAMENKERPIFVVESWKESAALQQLDDFKVCSNLAEQLERELNIYKLEKWIEKVRPDIQIIPLSGVREYAGERSILGVSGSSKITQFDHGLTEEAFRFLLAGLNPEDVVIATGGTDYGVEAILHQLIRHEFSAFGLVGFITNEGRGDELGTPVVTVAGNDWFGKSVPFLNSIDYLMSVAGGGVIHQELLMAYKADVPTFALAGSGMKTDEFLQTHPDVPRYHGGDEIAAAIRRDRQERSAPRPLVEGENSE